MMLGVLLNKMLIASTLNCKIYLITTKPTHYYSLYINLKIKYNME